jgi:glyoxylase-like metal-dependent hydrolase (beta-lactamase superfamily II)
MPETPVRVPVEAPTRALAGTTSAYVIGSTNALLVDPAARAADLTDAISERGVGHVAVTHHHPDHVGAVADYAREYGLTVWARAGRGDAFERATGVAPDRTVGPGETIPAADGVKLLDTPGHAPEHVAFDTDAGLLCGDLAVAAGSVVVGAPEGDMRAYLSSLRRVYARNPDRLFPAHGPVIKDARATCARLIEHRLDREKRVEAAVAAGHATPEAIVEAAYDKDVSDVAALAQATVVAHLEKLAVENRVGWDGQRATPR